VVIGEGFAGRFVSDERCDEGPVEDFVLGARVNGHQKTNTKTSLDFVSHPTAARLVVILDGVTNNETVNQTPQAVIRSQGSYQFQLTKQIEFDGQVFRTWGPSAFLRVNQRNLGAATPVSNIPLLGPLASNIALSEAERRRPIAEQIAAMKVTQNVAPEFNSRLDEELIKLNKTLEQQVRSNLSLLKLLPGRVTILSTDDAVLMGVAYADGNSSSVPTIRPSGVYPGSTDVNNNKHEDILPNPPLLVSPDSHSQSPGEPVAPPPPSGTGPTSIVPTRDQGWLVLHESLIGELATKSPLAGLELPLSSLVRMLRPDLLSAENNEGELATVIFAADRPLSVRFAQQEVLMELRMGFRPSLGPAIPQQVFVIAVKPTLEANQLRIRSELRSIRPVSLQPGDQLGPMVEAVVRQVIEQQLRESVVPVTYSVPRGEGQSHVSLRLQTLTMNDGWLAVAMESSMSPSPQPVPDDDWRPTPVR
jgi:hypothetical protein